MKLNRIVFVFLVLLLLFNNNLVAFSIDKEKAAGRIVSLSGTVTVEKSGSSENAKPFQMLDENDVITTGANSRVAILLRDESLVKLNSNSQTVIQNVLHTVKPASTGASEKTRIMQNSGEIWIEQKIALEN